MKLIYIAGPYRAETAYEIECNVRKAERMALAIACEGMVPVCPHTMYRFFHGYQTEAFWLEATGAAPQVRRCRVPRMVGRLGGIGRRTQRGGASRHPDPSRTSEVRLPGSAVRLRRNGFEGRFRGGFRAGEYRRLMLKRGAGVEPAYSEVIRLGAQPFCYPRNEAGSHDRPSPAVTPALFV